MTEDNTPHIHAEKMAMFAEDALETSKPWLRWESAHLTTRGDVWARLSEQPGWHPMRRYRRVPQTILIGDVVVPRPMREAPADGTKYYVTDINTPERYRALIWRDRCSDRRYKARGLAHTSEAAAVCMAKTLLASIKDALV